MTIDSIFKKEPSLQCYLDASLYGTIRSPNKNVTASKKKVEVQQTFPI